MNIGDRRGLLVIVTGFGPFQTFDKNPSEKVVRRLGDEGIEFTEDCTLITEIIPVAYNDVNQAVFRLWKSYKPDLVVHVGAHPDPKIIYLEQQSYGEGYDRYDIKCQLPAGQVCPRSLCCELDENVIVSGLDCSRILKNASSNVKCDALQWKVSHDPGRYLCGYSYFISLSHDRNRSLFVHVPDFDDKITEDVVCAALKQIIKDCIAQISRLQK